MNNLYHLNSCLVKMSVRIFCFLLATSVALVASGQDSAWKSNSITADVAIFMPEPTTSVDTTQVKAINSKLNGYFFQLKYLTQKFEVRNGDELIQAYDGFLNGYLKTKDISSYTNTIVDTSLNGTMGEWIHSSYSRDTFSMEMYTYLVLVNSHFYMITLAANHPLTAVDPTLSKYFASLRFLITPIKEHSGDFPLQARSYRNGQHIGQWVNAYLPLILGLSVGILFIVLVFWKIRTKRKRKRLGKNRE